MKDNRKNRKLLFIKSKNIMKSGIKWNVSVRTKELFKKYSIEYYHLHRPIQKSKWSDIIARENYLTKMKRSGRIFIHPSLNNEPLQAVEICY